MIIFRIFERSPSLSVIPFGFWYCNISESKQMRYACLSTCTMHTKAPTSENVLDTITLKVRHLFCVKIHIIEIKLSFEENTQLPLILGYCLEDTVWNLGHWKPGRS